MQTQTTLQTLTVAPLELKKLFINRLHSIFLLDTLDMADAQAAIESIMSLYGVKFKSLEECMEAQTIEVAYLDGIEYVNGNITAELSHFLNQDTTYQALSNSESTAAFFFDDINSRAHRTYNLFELKCFRHFDFSTFTQYPTA